MKSLFFLLLLSASLVAEVRTWTNASGKKLKAEFVSADETHVVLKKPRSSKTYKIKIDTLSGADQEAIKSILAEEAAAAEEKKAQSMMLGGTQLQAGKVNGVTIAIPEAWTEVFGREDYDVAIALPPNFDPSNKYTLVLTRTPGFGNDAAPVGALNMLAQKHNCVVFGINVKGGKTTEAYHHMALLLNEKWGVVDDQWPLITIGFSGGGKEASIIAVYSISWGYNVVGSIMSGVNEAHFDKFLEQAKHKSPIKKQFKKMAVALLSGTKDNVATPNHHVNVTRDIKESGIKNVKTYSLEGAHSPFWHKAPEALEWILATADTSSGLDEKGRDYARKEHDKWLEEIE